MTFQEELLQEIADAITVDIEPLFKPGARVTVLVRNPGPDCDVLVTLDTIPELIAALEKLQGRSKIKHPLAP